MHVDRLSKNTLSVIDALTAHVALLDGCGVIVAVNEAWRQFADANGSRLPGYGVGNNYLQLLEKLSTSASDHSCSNNDDQRIAAAVIAGIRGVIDGQLPRFQLEYPCHSPWEHRWFLLTVSPFTGEGSARVVVHHENISAIKAAEEKARNNGEQMARAFSSMIECIALAIEKRDPYTAGHQRQVANIAREIGRIMGLPEERLFGLHLGATIHDIGKISIPAEILNRPGQLSAPEYAIIRCHSDVGREILQGVDFPWPIADMVFQHHERIDGSGYPNGLVGQDICLEARIIAVADVFDAIVSHRPYRPGRGVEAAIEELHLGRGKIYDPEVVDASLSHFAKFDSWKAQLTLAS